MPTATTSKRFRINEVENFIKQVYLVLTAQIVFEKMQVKNEKGMCYVPVKLLIPQLYLLHAAVVLYRLFIGIGQTYCV